MNRSQILRLVLVVLIVCSTFGSVGVFAQPEVEDGPVGSGDDEPGTEANETATDNAPGAADSDSDGGDGSDGGGDDGGGPLDAAGEAWDRATDAAGNAATGGAQAAANTALGPVFALVLDVPLIEFGYLDGEPGLHAPEEWPASALFWVLYMGIGLPVTTIIFTGILFASFGMLPLAALPVTPGSTYSYGEKIVRAFAAIVFGIAFHSFFIEVFHRFIISWVDYFAPTPGEMITEMGLLEFSLATAFVGMGLIELGWDIVKWLGLMHGVIWIYIAFFPMLSMPFFATWIFAPRSTLGRFSSYAVLTYVALMLSIAAAAVELHVVTQLDWAANVDGLRNVFLSLSLLAMFFLTSPLTVLFMWLSKSRMMSAVGVGAGALAGSTIAHRLRESERVQRLKEKEKEKAGEVKERGKSYTKRKAANTQAKWWDVKNRSKALGSIATGSAAGTAYAGKERFDRWRTTKGSGSGSGFDSSSGSEESTTATDGGASPSTAERMRRLEEMNDRAGGLTTTQRKNYFHMKMEERGAYDSGKGSDTSTSTSTSTSNGGPKNDGD